MNMRPTRWLWLALGASLCTSAVAQDTPECHHDVEEVPATGPSALIRGDFDLVDVSSGRSVTQDSYDGHVRVVFFGFTSCTTICPIGMMNLSRMLDELGDERSGVRTLFITTDPYRDSTDAMATYVSRFADDIVGLRGTDEQLAAASRAFRTEAVKVDIASEEVYQMDHPGIFYLMDRHGRYLRTMDSAGDPKELAAQVRTALASSSK
jgi:protein SCO1